MLTKMQPLHQQLRNDQKLDKILMAIQQNKYKLRKYVTDSRLLFHYLVPNILNSCQFL